MASQQTVLLLQVFSFLLVTVYSASIIPQPDDVLDGTYDNLNHNITHVCTRTCMQGAPPKVCYYKFTLEAYTVLGSACKNCPANRSDCYNEQCVTADGFPRAILTINRRISGPSIQVCTGDTIVVDVINKMKGRSVVIHWHGIHQKNTQYMDGVSMVTQCPILEGQEFRYKFLAQRPGTYFYHSHSGLQKLDGIGGSLIIRDPKRIDPHRNLFDNDLPSHVLVIQDWLHISAEDRLPRRIKNPGNKPDSYLINGRGVYSPSISEALNTPITEFRVQPGGRYRFRIITNTCLTCSVEISFASHPMMVISSDERDLEPLVFDKIILGSAERYDVVIKADKTPRTYWIMVQGIGDCAEVFQIAALTYISNTSGTVAVPDHPIFALPSINQGAVVLNSKDINCTNVEYEGRCISQMRSLQKTPAAILKVKPDLRLTFAFNFFLHDVNRLFTSKEYLPFFVPVFGFNVVGRINNVTLAMSPSPLLTQRRDIPNDLFCTPECQQTLDVCECLNIVKVPLNSVVEIVIADMAFISLSHPFHLHGHSFHVVTQGKWGPDWNATLQDLYQQLDSGILLHDRLPVKDTITIPSKGYTVFRVLFDNPGYWLMHCHFVYHLDNGMASIFQVGDESNLGPIPQGFPTCGNFLPDI